MTSLNEEDLSGSILLAYGIAGPPIGLLALSITETVIACFSRSQSPELLAVVAAACLGSIFSYFFGLFAALVTGWYYTKYAIKRRTFSIYLYFIIAIATGALNSLLAYVSFIANFATITSNQVIDTILASFCSALVMLHFAKRMTNSYFASNPISPSRELV